MRGTVECFKRVRGAVCATDAERHAERRGLFAQPEDFHVEFPLYGFRRSGHRNLYTDSLDRSAPGAVIWGYFIRSSECPAGDFSVSEHSAALRRRECQVQGIARENGALREGRLDELRRIRGTPPRSEFREGESERRKLYRQGIPGGDAHARRSHVRARVGILVRAVPEILRVAEREDFRFGCGAAAREAHLL